MLRKPLCSERGTAAFMALLVVSIVTAMAIVWFMQMRVSVKRTEQMLTAQQAYLYAEGVVAWAQGALQTDDKMPMDLPQTITAGGRGWVKGHVDAMEGGELQPIGIQSKQVMASPAKRYLLRTDVKLDDQYLVLYSILQRNSLGETQTVEVITQARGEP